MCGRSLLYFWCRCLSVRSHSLFPPRNILTYFLEIPRTLNVSVSSPPCTLRAYLPPSLSLPPFPRSPAYTIDFFFDSDLLLPALFSLSNSPLSLSPPSRGVPPRPARERPLRGWGVGGTGVKEQRAQPPAHGDPGSTGGRRASARISLPHHVAARHPGRAPLAPTPLDLTLARLTRLLSFSGSQWERRFRGLRAGWKG